MDTAALWELYEEDEWDEWDEEETHLLPVDAAGEPADGVFVEIFVDEAWVDITRTSAEEPGVYFDSEIVITRGQADEQQQLAAGMCSFTLNNKNGRYSPRNPNSPYYGKIGRNTRVRCGRTVNGTRFYRFHGEIPEWPVQWDITGTSVYVPITAAGPTRRLAGRGAPLDSALYRAYTRPDAGDLPPVLAYWPMEDPSGSTGIAAASVGTGPMLIAGTPTLATSTVFPGSGALPTMGTAQMTGIVRASSTTNEIMVRFLLQVPSGGLTNNTILAQVDTTSNEVARWELYYTTASSGSIALRALDGDGATVSDPGAGAMTGYNGTAVMISIEIQQNGTSIDWGYSELLVSDTRISKSFTSYTSIASSTVGRATTVYLAPSKNLGDTVIGHLVVHSQVTDLLDLWSQTAGFATEQAIVRLRRLCAEEGVQFTYIGNHAVLMGSQSQKRLVDLMEECRTADLGFLYEARDYYGYVYKASSDTTGMTASLTLDYTAHQLADAIPPVDDDQNVENDVTVTRPSGSSYRAVLEAGALSVQDPPDGVGRNASSTELNLWLDSQLAEHAWWRLHVGTVDEPRYPTISLNLSHPSMSDYATLSQVLALEIGQVIAVTNPPAWLPPETIQGVVLGYTEHFTGLTHTMVLNAVPASPYTVAVYETDRYGTAGSQLTGAVTDSAVSVSVTTTLGPVWTQAAGDMPFTVMVGGEQWTVSAVSGATSPQTFTVTRSVNGITKSHPAGTAVQLATDAIRGLRF